MRKFIARLTSNSPNKSGLDTKYCKKQRSNEKTFERIANFCEKSPSIRIWVRLNQSATLIALTVAIAAFCVAYNKTHIDRDNVNYDRITKAWDTVTRMAGKNSNGGQINAINVLVKNDISLDNIDLRNTYLAGADLRNASLRGAQLSGSDLTGVNLEGADLQGANLDKTILYKSNLKSTQLDDASIKNACLKLSKISISIILSSSLANTNLSDVIIVSDDSDDEKDFSSFGDTIGESPAADGAQRRMDEACIDANSNKNMQKIPITLPKRACIQHLISCPKSNIMAVNPFTSR